MNAASEQQDLNLGRNQLQIWVHFALLTAIAVLLSTGLAVINSLILEIVIFLNLSLDNASSILWRPQVNSFAVDFGDSAERHEGVALIAERLK